MAYNVLDGTVDYSTTQHTELVDAHANQEIKGTKIIVGKLLTQNGREIVPPAITEIAGGVKNGLLTYQKNHVAKAELNLTFDGNKLVTKEVQAERFVGSAEGMSAIPANRFKGKIEASSLQIGAGIHNVRNHLQVLPGDGIGVDKDGVSLLLGSKSGLSLKNRSLTIDPKNTVSVDVGGQNLSDDDMVLIHDTSRGEVRHTTLTNLYEAYVKRKMPEACGPINSLQFKAQNGFKASPSLTFDPQRRVLNVDGRVVTDDLTVTGRTNFEGFITKNIKTVSDANYHVQPSDYTILCDTSRHKATVTLPAACNNNGRIVIIKKINSDKFKLHSHLLTIDVEEGEIDFKKSIEVKFTYSTITTQSDGKKWWIIGKTGT